MRISWASAFVVGVLVVLAGALPTWATTVDVIVAIDESGSMSGEHAWIGPMITSLDAKLTALGYTGRYGLVGFAGMQVAHPDTGHQHNVGGGQMGTAAQFSAATSSLVAYGGTEDGYDATHFALGYTMDPGAAVNVILITDEERDVVTASLNYTNVLAELNAQKALLNVVVDSRYRDSLSRTALGVDSDGNAYIADGLGGYTKGTGGVAYNGYYTTIPDYVNMALATGAAAWDIQQLRLGGATADSFTQAFVDIKVHEIEQQIVPEPLTLLGVLAGIGGAGAYIRRRIRA